MIQKLQHGLIGIEVWLVIGQWEIIIIQLEFMIIQVIVILQNLKELVLIARVLQLEREVLL